MAAAAPRAGRKARYRFGVRNVGNVPANDVRVRVRLPRLLEHLRGGRRRRGSRVVTFSLGRIAPGKGKSRAMKVRVKRSAKGRRIALRTKVTRRAPAAAAAAARTAAMPTVRAPVASGAPRQRFVAAYGLCRIVIRD